jgi:hypothetical protein
MNLRIGVAVAILSSIPHGAAALTLTTSRVTMDVTTTATSVTLNVTVNDPGGFFFSTQYLISGGKAGAAIFPRVPGTTNVFTLTETNLQPDVTYWYTLYPWPPGDDYYQFWYELGSTYGLPINIPGYTGTAPRYLYTGRLVNDGDGFSHVELCGNIGSITPPPLPSGWEQYAGTIVALFGHYCCWEQSTGWGTGIDRLDPSSCGPVATEPVTWGQVKSKYR